VTCFVDHDANAFAYLELRELREARERVELANHYGSMTPRRYGWWRGLLAAVPRYVASEDEWPCVLECLATREQARADAPGAVVLGEQQAANDLEGACAPWRFSGVWRRPFVPRRGRQVCLFSLD